jgi:hypothetical protein
LNIWNIWSSNDSSGSVVSGKDVEPNLWLLSTRCLKWVLFLMNKTVVGVEHQLWAENLGQKSIFSIKIFWSEKSMTRNNEKLQNKDILWKILSLIKLISSQGIWAGSETIDRTPIHRTPIHRIADWPNADWPNHFLPTQPNLPEYIDQTQPNLR